MSSRTTHPTARRAPQQCVPVWVAFLYYCCCAATATAVVVATTASSFSSSSSSRCSPHHRRVCCFASVQPTLQQRQQQKYRFRHQKHRIKESSPSSFQHRMADVSSSSSDATSSAAAETGEEEIWTSALLFPKSSSTVLFASPTKTTTTVKWEDLLQATQPLDCSLDDDECLFRQLPLDGSSKSTEPSKAFSDDVIYTSLDEAVTGTDVLLLGAAVTVGMTLLFGLLLRAAGPGAWRYTVAGGSCAAISHMIPVPIDTVKTRKQIDPAYSRLHFTQALQSIVKTEGFAGLWVGLGPTAVGYALEGAIKFGVYEVLKPVVSQSLSQLAALSSHLLFLQTKVVAYALSAAFAGAAASVVLCPMEALRIRLVVAQPIQYTSSSSSSSSSATTPNVGVRSRKNNWLVTGCEILRTEGLSTLGTGMIPMLLKQVPYTITKNVSFDFITRYAYDALQWRGSMIGPWMKLAVPFTAAAIASILSCVTSQPGDMLLTLSTARSGDRRRTRDIIRDIVRSERGSAGFFVGMKTRFFHLGIIVTVQLLIYDYLKRLCGIAPTGSA